MWFGSVYRYISSVNRQNLTFKVAVNHMADYSDKELHALRGVFKSASSPRGRIYVPTLKDVPSLWNWWLEGTLFEHVIPVWICSSRT